MNNEEALRDRIAQTGEDLARANETWTQAHNTADPTAPALLETVSEKGIMHLDALLEGGAFSDAFPLALTLLYLRVNFEAPENPLADLALLTESMGALDGLVSELPQDEFTAGHILAISTGLATALAAAYTQAHAVNTQSEWLAHASHFLRIALANNLVQEEARPLAETLGDVLGRAVALGLMAEE